MSTRGFEQFTAGDAARHNARTGTKAAGVPQRARSKYGAVATVVDGIRFHSAGEARRYGHLRVLECAGEIRDLERQPVFLLWAHRFGDPTVAMPVGKFIADFRYYRQDGELVIEDFKGVATPLYKLKKRIVEAQYGVTIVEVR